MGERAPHEAPANAPKSVSHPVRTPATSVPKKRRADPLRRKTDETRPRPQKSAARRKRRAGTELTRALSRGVRSQAGRDRAASRGSPGGVRGFPRVQPTRPALRGCVSRGGKGGPATRCRSSIGFAWFGKRPLKEEPRGRSSRRTGYRESPAEAEGERRSSRFGRSSGVAAKTILRAGWREGASSRSLHPRQSEPQGGPQGVYIPRRGYPHRRPGRRSHLLWPRCIPIGEHSLFRGSLEPGRIPGRGRFRAVSPSTLRLNRSIRRRPR